MSAPAGFKRAGWQLETRVGAVVERLSALADDATAAEWVSARDRLNPGLAPHVARELFVRDDSAPEQPAAGETETIWDRDARAAMAGLCASEMTRDWDEVGIADWARKLADALAAERAKRGGR